MKISYLPIEDRKVLKVLRHTESIEEIINILNGVVARRVSLHSLMEYRKWFLLLSQEQLVNNSGLIYGMAMIYFLQGNLDKAGELRGLMKEEDKYTVLYDVMTSRKTIVEQLPLMKEIVHSFPEDYFMLTIARPSAMNGLWDITSCCEDVVNKTSKDLEEALRVIFANEIDDIMDILMAESLYQRNRCYEALVILLGKLPLLERKKDLRLLFVALTLETYIMIINGQASSTHSLMDNLKQKMISNELKIYLPNVEALDAWAAMYDGEYTKVVAWMRDEAPDEYNDFSFLDLFRYMVKIRAYIIQGKYLSVTSLAIKLKPLLETTHRYMDLCELHMLWAISDDSAGRTNEAYEHINEMLSLASKYRYDRVIADEGMRMYLLLKKYAKNCVCNKYLKELIKLTEKAAYFHVGYLKKQLPDKEELTKAEMKVLRLIAECHTNQEIVDIMGIALDTVKQHCSHIYRKLEVKNRQQAVKTAVDMGILNSNILLS